MFVVSWKSADESLADVDAGRLCAAPQIDAIDTVRELLGVESVHAIGYCVAGTTLAATLALLAARGRGGQGRRARPSSPPRSISREAGDLNLFLGDEQMELIRQLSADKGYLDGRYMAATFNLLRGRDLIWNYVTNNYLLGRGLSAVRPAPLEQRHDQPAGQVAPGLSPAALPREQAGPARRRSRSTARRSTSRKVKTPTYVQAGREDHIAPPQSVWKITHHFQGPMRFVLAGSGHIAGVVNPPEAQKYQYWTNEEKVDTLDEFIAGATETKGSWWPDWIEVDRAALPTKKVPAKGARVPGKGKLKAIEDAPGSYVRAR